MTNPPVTKAAKTFPWAAPLLSLTLFFSVPVQVFLRNFSELDYGLGELLPWLAGLALAGAIVVALAALLVPAAASEKVQALMLATAFLLWLQANVLVWDYGILDGRDIHWGALTLRGAIDSALWLLLLASAWRFSRPLQRLARPLTLALIAIQALTIAHSALGSGIGAGPQRYGIDFSQEFSFSRERNIIIIVLDTFQTDVFQELLNDDSAHAKRFSGFTYFRNSLGGSPHTRTAIPFILTGRQYENTQPLSRFLSESYRRSSIPLLLKGAGFRCDLFPWNFGGITLDPALADNLTARERMHARDAAFLLDIGLFRQAPHFLKRVIHNDQRWLLTRCFDHPAGRRSWNPAYKDLSKAQKSLSKAQKNKAFLKAMKATGRMNASRPTLKYFHLRGLHPPLFADPDRQVEKLEFNRAGYERAAAGLVGMMERFLAELKRIGAFDHSLVFIVGDHGPGPWGLQEIHLQALGGGHPPEGQDEALKAVKSGALPLLLVKPLAVSGRRPLIVSDAPASLGDIPATVAAECGLVADFPGRPLFAIRENEDRERRFLHFKTARENSAGTMSAMSEYFVRGCSWLDSSWRSTGRIFAGGKPRSPESGDR